MHRFGWRNILFRRLARYIVILSFFLFYNWEAALSPPFENLLFKFFHRIAFFFILLSIGGCQRQSNRSPTLGFTLKLTERVRRQLKKNQTNVAVHNSPSGFFRFMPAIVCVSLTGKQRKPRLYITSVVVVGNHPFFESRVSPTIKRRRKSPTPK